MPSTESLLDNRSNVVSVWLEESLWAVNAFSTILPCPRRVLHRKWTFFFHFFFLPHFLTNFYWLWSPISRLIIIRIAIANVFDRTNKQKRVKNMNEIQKKSREFICNFWTLVWRKSAGNYRICLIKTLFSQLLS